MTQENSRKQVYLPIVFAFILVLGIFIGRHFLPNSGSTKSNPLLIYPQTNKLEALLNLIEEEYVDTVNREKIAAL